MNTETIIGIAASIGTGVSLVPQLVKTIKEKEATVSLGMMTILFAGLGLWVVYGVFKNDWIIIVSNAFSFSINLVLGIFAIKYRNK